MTQQLDEQEWVWRERALAEEEQELGSHTVFAPFLNLPMGAGQGKG